MFLNSPACSSSSLHCRHLQWKTIACSVICCCCGPEPTSVSEMSSKDANINAYEEVSQRPFLSVILKPCLRWHSGDWTVRPATHRVVCLLKPWGKLSLDGWRACQSTATLNSELIFQQRTSARNATTHPNDSSIALTLHRPLYPPGRIIHIIRHHPTANE